MGWSKTKNDTITVDVFECSRYDLSIIHVFESYGSRERYRAIPQT